MATVVNTKDTPAYARLQYLFGVAVEPNETTRGGVIRPKTKKQRQLEMAIAEETARFAFDHAGITNGHLAPGGLILDLLTEVGGYR